MSAREAEAVAPRRVGDCRIIQSARRSADGVSGGEVKVA